MTPIHHFSNTQVSTLAEGDEVVARWLRVLSCIGKEFELTVDYPPTVHATTGLVGKMVGHGVSCRFTIGYPSV